ncbi:MAG: YitT family protein [Calditrichaeota bacterium]|nr:YitT family protein [Calditrichota bacterium]
MGLKGFLEASSFIDGGITGVSMLVAKASPLPLALLIPLVDLPFIAVAWRQLGPAFAVRSALVLLLLPCPHVTRDPLLIAVFGGFFLGAGIGLAIRGGAVLDGTEIAALLIISDRSKELREAIMHTLGREVTVFRGKGGMTGQDQEILYCVLTRLEIGRVRGITTSLDPRAFIVMQPLGAVQGGHMQKPLHG